MLAIQPKRFKLSDENYLHFCKIKMLGQNTLGEPTIARNKSGRRPIAREGTSRLFLFRVAHEEI